MNTLIELYDDCQLENVIAALHLRPKKLIFVGFHELEAERDLAVISRFFEMRKMPVQIEYIAVSRYSYQDILDKINAVIDAEPDCCFDLTGGKELVLVAMGAVSATRQVPMLQLDIKRNRITKIAHCDRLIRTEPIMLTVRESFALNGGKILESYRKERLSDELIEDIKAIWSIAKKDFTEWNQKVKSLGALEKHFALSEHGTAVEINTAAQACEPDYGFINTLKMAGLLINYKRGETSLSYRYKNDAVKECISKSGNVLELYTYLAAQEISDEKPGYFDGLESGVQVSWNAEEAPHLHNIKTANEIDVVMMRDTIPVFVSCKGGRVSKEALYELNTIADRLGGKYAIKLLVATGISDNELARKQLLQRARDMNIIVISDVDRMDLERFKQKLMEATER